MRRILAFVAPCLAALALAACSPKGGQPVAGFVAPLARTGTGKTQLSLPLVGAGMVRAAALSSLVVDGLSVADAKLSGVVADAHKAAAGVQAAGLSLVAGGGMTGDGKANLDALRKAMAAVAAGVSSAMPDKAAQAQDALDAVDNVIALARIVPPAAVPVAVPAAPAAG